jgi:hypothetical protein
VYIWQDDEDGRIARECIPRQLAMAGPLHHKDVRQLFLEIRIKGQIIQALINCGAKGNFIHPKLVKTLQLNTRIKDKKYPLYTINDAPINDNNSLVEIETRPTLMTTTSGHAEEITFNIVRTAHPIVLGILWLNVHNPSIDWKKQFVDLAKCLCHKVKRRIHGATVMTTEVERKASAPFTTTLPIIAQE